MDDGCGTRVIMPADARRVAELEQKLENMTEQFRVTAELLAQAMLTLAKHSHHGMRDLNRWVEEQTARAGNGEKHGG